MTTRLDPVPEDVVCEVWLLLKELMRCHGSLSRVSVLERIATTIQPGEEPNVMVIENGLAQVLNSLPPEARSSAAEMFLCSSDSYRLKLRVRQERVALTMYGVGWESFRKRFEDRLLEDLARRLVEVVNQAADPGRQKQDPLPELLQAMTSVDQAVFLVDALLIVKSGARVTAKTLSASQLHELRTNEIKCLEDPERALAFLLEPDDSHDRRRLLGRRQRRETQDEDFAPPVLH